MVSAQGVFLYVKPSAFASCVCVRAQVAMDVYPLCPKLNNPVHTRISLERERMICYNNRE